MHRDRQAWRSLPPLAELTNIAGIKVRIVNTVGNNATRTFIRSTQKDFPSSSNAIFGVNPLKPDRRHRAVREMFQHARRYADLRVNALMRQIHSPKTFSAVNS